MASYIAVPPRGEMRRHGAAETRAVGRPALHERRVVAEAIHEDLIVLLEQIEQEPIERRHGMVPLLAFHAAARVDHEAEADRHTFGAEVRHVLRAPRLRRRRSLPVGALARSGRRRR